MKKPAKIQHLVNWVFDNYCTRRIKETCTYVKIRRLKKNVATTLIRRGENDESNANKAGNKVQ